ALHLLGHWPGDPPGAAQGRGPENPPRVGNDRAQPPRLRPQGPVRLPPVGHSPWGGLRGVLCDRLRTHLRRPPEVGGDRGAGPHVQGSHLGVVRGCGSRHPSLRPRPRGARTPSRQRLPGKGVRRQCPWRVGNRPLREEIMPETSLVPFLAVFAAAGIFFLLLWYLVSSLLTRRRERMRRRIGGTSDSDISIVLDELPGRAPPPDLSTRVNRGFDRMIERTGLGLPPPLA